MLLITRENEEGLCSLMRCTSFVAGNENSRLQREHTGELGSQKGRGVVVPPTLFLDNTGVIQNVFNSLESGFRNSKAQNYAKEGLGL